MLGVPRTNWILFGLYVLASIAVLILAIISPGFRQVAPAPLRDLLLPKPAPVEVNLLYSTEKEGWLKDVLVDFAASNPTINGRPIEIKLKSMGSRDIYLAVLEGKEKPTIISPAGSLQTQILESLSASKFGKPLVISKDTSSCQSVVKTPLVLVGWQERAGALWNNDPGPDLWQKLHQAMINDKGWADYGHPDWGYVKFSHTNPLKSNSGFMTLLLMTYDYYQKTSGLTSQDILGNPDFQKWLLDFESKISQFGESTGTYMKDIINYGPSMYDLVAVYESSAIEQADNAIGHYGELRVYYPPATIVSDHPFCTLEADWVTPEQKAASQVFIKFLLAQPQQEKALLKYGFRPTNPAVVLDQPGSPLSRYATNGLKFQLPPEVSIPNSDVLNTLLDFWTRNINR